MAEKDETLGRLLSRIPPFIIEYMTSRSPSSEAHAFKWVDGKLLDKAAEMAIESFNQQADAADQAEGGETQQGKDVDAPVSGKKLAQEITQEIYDQASAATGSYQQVEFADEEAEEQSCNYPECGKQCEPGKNFAKCAHCGNVAYCSKECQRKDWRSHKLVCYPERLRMHVPEEAEIAYALKRMVVSNILPLIMSELSMAAVSWYQRLGRGLVVVVSSNFIFLHSPDGKDKCQLYTFYFPESEARSPEKVAAVPGLQSVLESAGGGKALFHFNPEKHMTIVFIDGEYQLSLSCGLVPPFEHCQQVLGSHGTVLRQQDLFAIDTMTGDRLLYDFHSLSASFDEEVGEKEAAREEGQEGQAGNGAEER